MPELLRAENGEQETPVNRQGWFSFFPTRPLVKLLRGVWDNGEDDAVANYGRNGPDRKGR